jgi:hypothetical protein
MSTALVVQKSHTVGGTESVGVSLPLNALSEPGTYVCNWSGHLLRVPEADRGTHRFSTSGAHRTAAWTVTRISADPRISQYQAKALADRLGLATSF